MRIWDRGLVIALALLLIGTRDLAWSQNVSADQLANGKRVYPAAGCFTCHGRSGQGGNFNYPAPALARIGLSVDAFKALVRKGPNDMPAYPASVLPDKDLEDIRTFLRSLPGRRPLEEIPLLNQ